MIRAYLRFYEIQLLLISFKNYFNEIPDFRTRNIKYRKLVDESEKVLLQYHNIFNNILIEFYQHLIRSLNYL